MAYEDGLSSRSTVLRIWNEGILACGIGCDELGEAFGSGVMVVVRTRERQCPAGRLLPLKL
jgi:hypothetical protein